ncbi:hypothetical protein BDP27DRAFT_1419914 [Rhodocollybia butyracea]|uniref:Uncharacterized protein n=1 Tax=Rhodocollybia butyracea TaxID=206335 RepID=A0A9P5PW93_9AGAR|nr:hypothetical protein BDP27DRAFT_1419914 [Rhodocollybia butyracea]
MSQPTVKFKVPLLLYVPMIANLLLLAGTLLDKKIAFCSPVSFLHFKSSYWLAVTVFVLALGLTIQHSLTRKPYKTKTQKFMARLPHLVCFLALIYIACWLIYMKYSLASCFPDDFSGWSLPLGAANALFIALNAIIHWFVCARHYVLARRSEIGDQEMMLYQSWVDVFVDASDFYLPAIEAAVDLRIGEYKAFYNNPVKSEAFGNDSYWKLTVLQKTIAVNGLLVSS